MRHGSTRFISAVAVAALAVAGLAVAPFFHPATAGSTTVTVASESFGASASSWSSWLGDSWVGRTTVGTRTAPGALKVTARSGASTKWYLPGSTFTTGVTYTFSVYAKLSSGTAQTFGSVQAFDRSWRFLQQANLPVQSLNSRGWTLITGTFNVPAGTANVTVNLGGPRTTWTLDDALITRPASAFVAAAAAVTVAATTTAPPTTTTTAPPTTTTTTPPPTTAAATTTAAQFTAADVPSGLTFGTLLHPFGSSSSWNTPVNPQAKFGGALPWPTSGTPWWLNNTGVYAGAAATGQASDPLVSVTYNYTGSTPYAPGGDAVNGSRWARPANTTIQIHIPAGVTGAGQAASPGQGDGSLVVLDPASASVYNFWQFTRVDATRATASGFGVTSYSSASGWGTPSSTPGVFPGGVNAGIVAAGASQYAGMITGAQVASGTIGHALAVQCDMNRVVLPNPASPAIWSDGYYAGGFLHEGDHLGIPSGTAKPASVNTPLGTTIWNALVAYGAYCIDIAGGTNTLVFDTNSVNANDIAAVAGNGNAGSAWADMGRLMQKVVG